MLTRVLGFDFGLRRIGIAIGQSLTGTASPVAILLADNGVPQSWPAIDALIKEWNPNVLVVGIPLNMDGSECSVTTAAKGFMQALQARTLLPVHPVDERLTTKEARLQLKEQQRTKISAQRVDALAACLIVETWLSTHFNTA